MVKTVHYLDFFVFLQLSEFHPSASLLPPCEAHSPSSVSRTEAPAFIIPKQVSMSIGVVVKPTTGVRHSLPKAIDFRTRRGVLRFDNVYGQIRNLAMRRIRGRYFRLPGLCRQARNKYNHQKYYPFNGSELKDHPHFLSPQDQCIGEPFPPKFDNASQPHYRLSPFPLLFVDHWLSKVLF